jgi:hypothetical protein
MEAAPVVCSFCGKNQDEVRKLIAGPYVYICDECIDRCNEIIEEECEEEQGPGEPPAPIDAFVNTAQCLLCSLPKGLDELVSLPERGFMCLACVDAVFEAADARRNVAPGRGDG